MATEPVIIANMCMIYDNEGNILVQERVSEKWPGIAFPGGNVEHGESFVNSVKREVMEETGLEIENPELCGIKQFQTDNDRRYIVLMYKTKEYSGELRSSNEGPVFWLQREKLFDYQLSESFRDMLKVFEDNSVSECYYNIDSDEWDIL